MEVFNKNIINYLHNFLSPINMFLLSRTCKFLYLYIKPGIVTKRDCKEYLSSMPKIDHPIPLKEHKVINKMQRKYRRVFKEFRHLTPRNVYYRDIQMYYSLRYIPRLGNILVKRSKKYSMLMYWFKPKEDYLISCIKENSNISIRNYNSLITGYGIKMTREHLFYSIYYDSKFLYKYICSMIYPLGVGKLKSESKILKGTYTGNPIFAETMFSEIVLRFRFKDGYLDLSGIKEHLQEDSFHNLLQSILDCDIFIHCVEKECIDYLIEEFDIKSSMLISLNMMRKDLNIELIQGSIYNSWMSDTLDILQDPIPIYKSKYSYIQHCRDNKFEYVECLLTVYDEDEVKSCVVTFSEDWKDYVDEGLFDVTDEDILVYGYFQHIDLIRATKLNHKLKYNQLYQWIYFSDGKIFKYILDNHCEKFVYNQEDTMTILEELITFDDDGMNNVIYLHKNDYILLENIVETDIYSLRDIEKILEKL